VSDQPSQSGPNPPGANQPGDGRFKAEMPQIPGVSGPSAKPKREGGPLLVVGGLVAVLAAVFVGGKFLSRPAKHPDPPPQPAAQIDVPAPAPDLTPSIPVATEDDPVVAHIGDLAKPWDSQSFTFRNKATGENVPAILIRLPGGTGGSATNYYSVAMRAPFGNCQLEYVSDLDKLRTDYGYRQARHPLVGNPCSRTLFDPLKYATLPGNVLTRGAIVQGSDLRPPLGIEIRVKGKELRAVRME